MKTGLLFSGGKDSCLALHKFGKEEIDVLLSLMPKNKDSWMFHQPDLKLLKMQAKMLGLKLVIQKTEGKKDLELKDLVNLLKKSKIDKLVIGGLASNYQGDRLKNICSELGIKLEAPLWGYSHEKLWKELLDKGFKIILTKISCEGIPSGFLGEIIDKKKFLDLEKLSRKYKFRLDFEGGEAESVVLFMPGFRREIKVLGKIESEGDYRHFLKITGVK
ncbi:MAG: diphthine--ammonia ligase [Candidatus Pacearchaeota archaeon]|nr:diphthine--ammonia ligase [Candidatus Pacearchaeota archaeon]